MGFMTELSILNDRFGEIERDPAKFVADIREGMNRHGKYFIGQTTVHPSHHADTLHVYLAWRNSFIEAYPNRDEDAQALARRLERLGDMQRYIALCVKETKARIADKTK